MNEKGIAQTTPRHFPARLTIKGHSSKKGAVAPKTFIKCAAKKRISLLFDFSVNRIICTCEPGDEFSTDLSGKLSSKQQHPIRVQSV